MALDLNSVGGEFCQSKKPGWGKDSLKKRDEEEGEPGKDEEPTEKREEAAADDEDGDVNRFLSTESRT